ncbi:MAG: helix-turn-helix transcriptional regulator [Pirellulaceae bacterium]|nr:helix-turn-helix transcriptional regulator [Pirellulaceae bacterium]
MSLMMKTSHEMMLELGQRVRGRRLALDLTQAGLADRSGVSLSVLRLFERTGKISLESLLKLAIALNATGEFDALFQTNGFGPIVSLDELLSLNKQRKRGRTR